MVEEKATSEFLPMMDAHIPPSIEKAPTFELKPLPNHLRYAFLGDGNTLPIIVSNKLSKKQKASVAEMVKSKIKALGW